MTLCSNESLLLYSLAQSKGKERQSTTTSRGTQKSTFHGLGGLGEGVGQGSGHGGGCGYGQECRPRWGHGISMANGDRVPYKTV